MAEGGYKVSLNVYDLSQGLARQLSTSFLGKAIEAIWHTGVVVYGNEYFFGGGIQHAPVGTTQYGTPMRIVDLGTTHVPKEVFEEYLQEISPQYTAETYSLLGHNCNNFSNEVAQFLVGTGIPDYILQLPNEVMSSPMGPLILPMIQQLETTLRAGAVPQVPQFRPANVPISTPVNLSPSIKPVSISLNPTLAKETKPAISNDNPVKSENKLTEKPSTEKSNGVVDPLGDARTKVQEEIGREFASLMASGTLRASEAATLATKKVMEKYGRMNITAPQS